jgi:hypothetical protein
MEWWTHLWLNGKNIIMIADSDCFAEGFASWVEYLAIDHIFPDWQVWTQFVYQVTFLLRLYLLNYSFHRICAVL